MMWGRWLRGEPALGVPTQSEGVKEAPGKSGGIVPGGRGAGDSWEERRGGCGCGPHGNCDAGSEQSLAAPL